MLRQSALGSVRGSAVPPSSRANRGSDRHTLSAGGSTSGDGSADMGRPVRDLESWKRSAAVRRRWVAQSGLARVKDGRHIAGMIEPDDPKQRYDFARRSSGSVQPP